MQTQPPAAEFRLGSVNVQTGHEREDADGKKDRRNERTEEPEARPDSKNQIGRDHRPHEEHRRFKKIIHRAAFEGKPAFEHGGGMKNRAGQKQKIIYAIVLAKAFSPKENRVNHADSVEKHGQGK